LTGCDALVQIQSGNIEFVGINRIQNFYGEGCIVSGVLKADDVL
jgi:hypothetical protein